MDAIPWFKKPLRIVDFIPPNPELMETLDYQEEFLIRKDLGFNAEHVEVHDVRLPLRTIQSSVTALSFCPALVVCRKNRRSKSSDLYVMEATSSPPLIHPSTMNMAKFGNILY